MKIYNSLTNKIEEFHPIKVGQVDMYVCGPTVYNDAHIGNARPIVVFDLLNRVFLALGYQVNYVSNFTDVDDKIIAKALEANLSEQAVTEKYIAAYNQIRTDLNTLPLKNTPKVTETIQPIINYIAKLIELGFAYEVAGDVYFRVNKVKEYGQLSKQNIDELFSGARIEENRKKENPLDFTLWKKTESGISWDTPWSKGRPGWHTECVVMINQEFQKTKIDIHGGGSDLKFPHHENEMAQALAMDDSKIANYWIHNGMVSIDDEKMSKSLGNVVLAKDVIAELGSNITRWLLLAAHYRDTLKYNEETIALAKTEVSKVETVLKQVNIIFQRNQQKLAENSNPDFDKAFLAQLENDLNTPNAYSEISQMVKTLNQLLRVKEIDYLALGKVYQSLQKALDILGIKIPERKLSEEEFQLFNDWDNAKAEKDFTLADQLRAELIELGLI